MTGNAHLSREGAEGGRRGGEASPWSCHPVRVHSRFFIDIFFTRSVLPSGKVRAARCFAGETAQGSMPKDQVAVPTVAGVIVGTPSPTDDEAFKIKYEKLKQRAKWLNAAAALLLCGVSVMSLAGTGESCSPMLIKVVMCWMSAIGAVLLLAELHVEKVLAYVHVLSYRSGRALIALMAGTITLAAAPSEIPMYATPRTHITLAPAALDFAVCGSGTVSESPRTAVI